VHVNRADAERQAAEAAERSRRLAELAEADPEEAARQAAEREAAAAVAAAEAEAEAEERRAAIASNHGQIPPPKGRFSRPSAPSMVMTMTFVENRIIAPPVDDEGGGAEEQQMMMHTGDDDGCVHRWDMTAAFRALKMAAVRLPKGTKVRRRASFVPHLQQCSPPTIAAPVSHAGCIQAHADAISLLHLTSEPTGLLTASFDRTVSFWTRAGGKCGTLVQGLLDGSQNPGWSLPMDVTDREAREAAQLDGMMARVGAVEGGAGGGEGGAQGGEAGAPARRPSVLELVQERHKEKEKGRAASLAAAAADEALAAVASAAGRGGAAAAAASSSSSSSSSSGGDGGGGGGLLPNERRAAVFSALDDANRSMGGADGDDDGGGSAFGGSSRGASRGAALDSQPGEWRAFKSTLPPIEKMSTSEFAKVADRQRGKPDPKAQTAAGLRREIKERKRRAGMLRSRAELAFEQTGRVPTPKPKPPSAELDGAVAFSSHTRNAVALLAQSIADWDHQPNVPDDEGADES
jgi:parvulin-like peptidyl-prolyl isomerase